MTQLVCKARGCFGGLTITMSDMCLLRKTVPCDATKEVFSSIVWLQNWQQYAGVCRGRGCEQACLVWYGREDAHQLPQWFVPRTLELLQATRSSRRASQAKFEKTYPPRRAACRQGQHRVRPQHEGKQSARGSQRYWDLHTQNLRFLALKTSPVTDDFGTRTSRTVGLWTRWVQDIYDGSLGPAPRVAAFSFANGLQENRPEAHLG